MWSLYRAVSWLVTFVTARAFTADGGDLAAGSRALQGSAAGPVVPVVRSPAREIVCRRVRGARWLACGEPVRGLPGVR